MPLQVLGEELHVRICNSDCRLRYRKRQVNENHLTKGLLSEPKITGSGLKTASLGPVHTDVT